MAVENFANAARRRLESNLHCTPTAARSANLEANRSGSLSSRHSTVNLPAAGAAAAPRRRAPATLTAYVSMDEDLRKTSKEIGLNRRRERSVAFLEHRHAEAAQRPRLATANAQSSSSPTLYLLTRFS